MPTWSNPWFDSWQELTSKQPWQSALEDWWGQFSKQSSSPHLRVFESIVEQSRLFFQMAEELGDDKALGGGAMADWQAALDQIFDSLKQSLDHPNVTQAPRLFWQMPLANWERTASSLSSLPGDFFSVASSHGEFDPNVKLDQFLSTPGVGYTREFLAEQQKLARLLVDYQRAYQEYATIFVEINKQSLELMRDRLIARTQPDQKPITTVRELYDLWVECSEEVYAQTVLTDEYAQMYGDMINALMAFKHQGAQMMDDVAAALNMPTRREMDTMHQRFQSSRRSNKNLQQEIAAMQVKQEKQSDQIHQLLHKTEQLKNSAARKKKKKAGKNKKEASKKSKKAAKGR